MVNKFIFLILFAFPFPGRAVEMRFYYGKNLEDPSTPYECQLVEHVKDSMHNALLLKSKLNDTTFKDNRNLSERKSDVPMDHLLNNLCSLPGASHLHVGIYKGASFIAALYGNQSTLGPVVGIDWFLAYPRKSFEDNCLEYVDIHNSLFIEGPCFSVEKSSIPSNIDIYFYDADHSLTGQELAFTYFNELFADVFIAVVDDWSCATVRRPAFKAFEKLNYKILFEAVIPKTSASHQGQYVAVIRKS